MNCQRYSSVHSLTSESLEFRLGSQNHHQNQAYESTVEWSRPHGKYSPVRSVGRLDHTHRFELARSHPHPATKGCLMTPSLQILRPASLFRHRAAPASRSGGVHLKLNWRRLRCPGCQPPRTVFLIGIRYVDQSRTVGIRNAIFLRENFAIDCGNKCQPISVNIIGVDGDLPCLCCC